MDYLKPDIEYSGYGDDEEYTYKVDSQVRTPSNWVFLSSADDSQAYEIDVTELYKVGDKFAVVFASGCSCWGGEWNAYFHDSLDAIAESLIKDDRQYSPSFEGAKGLLLRAKESLTKEA